MFWWLMKWVVLGPILRLMYRPEVLGLENVPEEGAAILAPNHQSFLDDFLMPLVIHKRKVRMLAKADYFEKKRTAWFFKAAGCIPVRREGGSAGAEALDAGIDALKNGELVGIFPEGTRSPDGRLYRGKTGVARMALEAQVPIIPVSLGGTFEAWPYDRKLPKRGRVTITFGKPLDFSRHYDTPADRFVLRSITDEVMYEIMLLSGQEYVDDYGSRAKKQIEEAAAEGEEMREPPRTQTPSDAGVAVHEDGVSVREPAPSTSERRPSSSG
jgi:1-acyl-sn-glycerol-3-phosphate acyltransferase